VVEKSRRQSELIFAWAPTAIAVADHLGTSRFMTIGISTGGSYSLCVAALYPERTERVIAVVTGCAMTDMFPYTVKGTIQEKTSLQKIYTSIVCLLKLDT
jgi:pimeloyl-ACP methyl ester carboxylesterase